MVTVPRRLIDERDMLPQYGMRGYANNYPVACWDDYFGDDEDYLALRKRNPQSLCRQDLADIADVPLTEAARARQLFLAAMIWGFGDRPYGAFRTSEMLATAGALDQIQSALGLVGRGRVLDAYRALQLYRCGASYISKFLYAAGLCTRSTPMPVILDSVVARSLSKLLKLQGDDPAQFLRLDGSGMPRRYPEGYERYVLTLNAWAKELDVQPDEIEYHLFDIELEANGGAVGVKP